MTGLAKFSGLLAPVPLWLDPAAEVHDPPTRALGRWEFAIACVDGFVAAGAPLAGAFGLAACKVSETGWGRAYRANNLGGVKATAPWARAYKARTGRSAPYWRAHGNVGTGDRQTVIYRAYDSIADFFDEWLKSFMPRPKPGVSYEGKRVGVGDYRLAGERFWREPIGDWFAAMLEAEYRGEVTKAHPTQAIADQASIARDIREAWVQSRLRAWQLAHGIGEHQALTVDAKWGTMSTAACRAYQAERGLETTGLPDDATCQALAAVSAT